MSGRLAACMHACTQGILGDKHARCLPILINWHGRLRIAPIDPRERVFLLFSYVDVGFGIGDGFSQVESTMYTQSVYSFDFLIQYLNHIY